MEDILLSSGLSLKKTISDDHLVEAVNSHGNSIIIWSGSKDISTAKHSQESAIRGHMNRLHEHAKNVSGLYIEHPGEGILVRHGTREISLIPNEPGEGSIRALPLLTVEELKHNHKASLIEADRVSSRISNALTVDVVACANGYHEAYIELDIASKNLFQNQDDVLHSMIRETRELRDNIKNVATKSQVSSVQRTEELLETLCSHADEIKEYAMYMKNIAARLNLLNEEMLALSGR